MIQPYEGGGIRFSNTATGRDGQFHIMIMADMSWFRFVYNYICLLLHKHDKLKGVRILKADSLSVETSQSHYQIDGELVAKDKKMQLKCIKEFYKIKKEERKLFIKKPILNKKVIRGSLSLACLTIGANIAFGNITASLGDGNLTANIDHLTIYSGLADSVSSLFGGAPVEAIISATGASDNPINSGVLMMAILGVIMFMGFLPKLGKYVPGESIHGFLFVLGALVTVPTNANLAFTAGGDTILVAGIAMATTAASDPFMGLVAGVILKFIIL